MEPFIGEIIMFGGNFAPRGWALCDGQLLSIQQNSALFSILGTTYGGDGRTTFGLPDLRGRVSMHAGSGPGLTTRRLGEKGGAETETLSVNEMPSHSHTVKCDSGRGDNPSPAGNVMAGDPDFPYAATAEINADMSSAMIANAGGGQGHNNVQPFQCVNYIIALQGTFPSRN